MCVGMCVCVHVYTWHIMLGTHLILFLIVMMRTRYLRGSKSEINQQHMHITHSSF